ncbi:hypothetical protein [Actinomadura luteofluorescens]|uniref:hypothetical protein n=1 Tax=Actinomadura luteofluorescens TaxID=46163 RepID=UPI0030D35A3F
MPEPKNVTLVVQPPTACKGWAEVTLRPGVIDDQALEVFGFSMCTLLACALHEKTGWPMLGIKIQQLGGFRGWKRTTAWWHVGVQTPCGRFLDIKGVRTCVEAKSEAALFVDSKGVPRCAEAKMVRLPTFTRLWWWMGVPGFSPSWWKREATADGGDSVYASGLLAPYVSTVLENYRGEQNAAA